MNIPLFDFKTNKPAIGQRCLMYFEGGIVMLGWWQGNLLKDNHSFCQSTPLAWQPVDPRLPGLGHASPTVECVNRADGWGFYLCSGPAAIGTQRFIPPTGAGPFGTEAEAWLAAIDAAAKHLAEHG